MKKLTLAVVLSGLFVFGSYFGTAHAQTQPVTAAKATAVTFTAIEKGTHSGLHSKKQDVLKTDADWKKLWEKHKSAGFPVPPVPVVDFSKEMVVAVFTGTRNSGGYSVSIVSIKDDGTNLVVTYRETEPAPGSITTAALTQPFVMVKVPLSNKPVKFVQAK